MPFVLHTYAVTAGGKVIRFQSNEKVEDGETLLPVIADPDPPLGPDDKLWGPDYEVLKDRVRAYGIAVPMTPEEIAERDAAVPRLSFAQLLIGLVAEGWISEADGDAWISGRLPDAVSAVISTLPKEQQFAAKARALRPSEVVRTDPLVNTLAVSQAKNAEAVDAFFAKYSKV